MSSVSKMMNKIQQRKGTKIESLPQREFTGVAYDDYPEHRLQLVNSTFMTFALTDSKRNPDRLTCFFCDYQSPHGCNVSFLLQCDPSDNAVPQGEQPLPNPDHLTGGDHPVTQHSGKHRQFYWGCKKRPLGLRLAGYRVPQIA